jgi:hypothetical protein
MPIRKKGRKSFNVINVKIPECLSDIIDENLKPGKALNIAGFQGRAHFAELAVAEKLVNLNLLAQQDLRELSERRNKPKRGLNKNSLN